MQFWKSTSNDKLVISGDADFRAFGSTIDFDSGDAATSGPAVPKCVVNILVRLYRSSNLSGAKSRFNAREMADKLFRLGCAGLETLLHRSAKSHRLAVVLVAIAVAQLAPQAQAGPDPCTTAGVCGGDQSGGVFVDLNVDVPIGIPTISFSAANSAANLTTNVGGVSWPWANGQTARSPTLNLQTGEFVVDGTGVLVDRSGGVAGGSTHLNFGGAGVVVANTVTDTQAPAAVWARRAGLTGTNDMSNSPPGTGGAGSNPGDIFLRFGTATQNVPFVITRESNSLTPPGNLFFETIGGAGGIGGRPGGPNNDQFKDTGGGNGGQGGQISIITTNTDVVINGPGTGIAAHATGGPAADGVGGKGSVSGGNAGDGGWGGVVSLQGDAIGGQDSGGSWTITTTADNAYGIELSANGQAGGNGGNATQNGSAFGGNAGRGGNGGFVNIFGADQLSTSPFMITTAGDNAAGVFARASAGAGGSGGDGSVLGRGGNGGLGGVGGEVTIRTIFDITTKGVNASGIVGSSLGGAGGQAGNGGTHVNDANGKAGSGGAVDIYTPDDRTIETFGDLSVGVSAQSVGGYGADGASTSGLVTFAASGGSAGVGGLVSIANEGKIKTHGFFAPGMLGMSVGGGGGHGGDTFGAFYGHGGGGSQGGDGGQATVQNYGSIRTGGASSVGMLAQSIGGTGGSGGSSDGLAALGGGAASGGAGSEVRVVLQGSIEAGDPSLANPEISVDPSLGPSTTGGSHGIVAQSIGGGGGHGGSSAGWFAIGGVGGSGDNGGQVHVNSGSKTVPASVTTHLDDSAGIIAQSIGGGGGTGGSGVAAGLEFSAAVGGGAGGGGTGNTADITLLQTTITTNGTRSPGVIGQSIGGGGGNGGFAVAVSAGIGAAVSGAVGGEGGGGGRANAVNVGGNTTTVTTLGDDSHGIISQSIAGGGGNGGFAMAGTAEISIPEAGGAAISAAVGGSGGKGGIANTADVTIDAVINTSGDRSSGIVSQSIGGGGGNGGNAIAVSGTVGTGDSKSAAISASVGGGSRSGGAATAATVTSSGSVTTAGDLSSGIIAQSIGGGGGNGGSTFSGNLTVSGAGDNSVGVSVGVGGSGGNGGAVTGTTSVDNFGTVSTAGANSDGIIAQSIAGGGGNGGGAIAGSATLSGQDGKNLAIDVGVGGGGGSGGSANAVVVNQRQGEIATIGMLSDAIVAQSIGGGGGNGGMAAAGNFSFSTGEAGSKNNAVNVAVGGSGGGGGTASTVHVEILSESTVSATGDGSKGIIAQSIGGGGGNGGMAVTGSFIKGDAAKSLNVGIGGKGGKAGASSDVTVKSMGPLEVGTTGDYAPNVLAAQEGGNAIVAQSIGGSGGTGGLSASAVKDVTKSEKGNSGDRSLNVNIGGGAGAGGAAGQVSVTVGAKTTTRGHLSDTIIAQSIGGGGGAGGGTVNFEEANKQSKSLSLSIGGTGGGSSDGKQATVTLKDAGAITASGAGSRGVVVQSIGGNGGAGGANHFSVKDDSAPGDALNVGIGGNASTASAGGAVRFGMVSGASVATGNGISSAPEEGLQLSGHAIVAQSIGGSGGAGGAGMTGNVQTADGDKSKDFNLGLGGKGSAGGNGGAVLVSDPDNPTIAIGGVITTSNWNSHGIFAQSLGGGGGDSGVGINGKVTNNGNLGLNVGIGSKGGSSGFGGPVTVLTNADVNVSGDDSKGIFAQSVGGGGGNGGIGINGSVEGGGGEKSKQLTFGLGGVASGGGNGGAVTLTNVGDITTATQAAASAREMDAIFAQSIGGGGGNGGIGINSDGDAMKATDGSGGMELTLGIGRDGQAAGAGGIVNVTNVGNLKFAGGGSRGIFAQSIGGGGGNGGAGIVGDLSTDDDEENSEENRYHLDVGIGAKGGQASDGNTVTVENDGTIAFNAQSALADQTTNAVGILAQSVGGGGGNAGIGIDGNMSGTKNTKAARIGIGGEGGEGGNGQLVRVTNIGDISVIGDGSRGVQAQSIGGGGGNGALGVKGTVATGSGDDDSDNDEGTAITVGLGRSGGNGGIGLDVVVSNSGSITTGTAEGTQDRANSDAFAVHAQSIGGGGGTGILSGGLVYGNVNESDTAKGIDFAVGSSASSGGKGGAVTVTNSGSLTTHYNASHGLYAQSIGGGGGHTGSLGGIGTDEDNLTWGATVAVGGSGSAGDGGEVDVLLTDANGTIVTAGSGAHGVFAQSIGGGGGSAANAAGQSGTGISGNSGFTTDNAKVGITIGGMHGSTGNGGRVQVAADTGGGQTLPSAGLGSITTQGDSSIGILAQSVAGGGGVGGHGLQGAEGSLISLGGTGNNGATSTGTAGTAFVSFGGIVNTSGAASHGILAQSVGGGGGLGGTVNMKPEGNWGSGPGVGMAGGDSGTHGDGGVVDLTLDGGSISTTGDSAVGILAQSVGGGGGIQGAATAAGGTAIGSAGGIGKAQRVSLAVSNGASVTTSGDFAHGIFAQAVGGSSASGVADTDVNILVDDASVKANGFGATGIIAQNFGANSNKVFVRVTDGGSVTGGTGTAEQTNNSNAAIWVLDGNTENLVRNDAGGTIASASGATGVAVRYSGPAGLTVRNAGEITGCFQGNITEPTGTLTTTEIVNEATGQIQVACTSTVDLLTNHGKVEIDQGDAISVATFAGDVINKQGSTVEIDLGRVEELGPSMGSDLLASHSGTIGFELGSVLNLEFADGFQAINGSSFDLLAGLDLWFEGEEEDDFSFFDFVTGDLIESEWEFSLRNESVEGLPLPIGVANTSFEVLSVRLVPEPGGLTLFGIALLVAGGLARTGNRRMRR